MKALPLLLALLGTCTMSASQAGGVAKPCDASKASSLIGAAPTTENGRKVMDLTGAKTLRWIRPGMMVTMDYRAERANIYIDAAERIERVSCG